jgi:glutaconyl-CoA/methylmalonyl-CoA decarboxylase subunit gamma
MKYRITVDEQTFEVEIQDLNARPVVALVDGVPVEVWPEAESAAQMPTGRAAARANGKTQTAAARKNGQNVLAAARAPIPGVVTVVDVKPGDEVVAGQQLCVLEAMKMNNSIKAARAGTIASVQASVGQQVKHNQVLVEFTE